MAIRSYELYVDDVRVFYSDSAFNVMIEANGFVDETGMAVGSYTYEEGEYLGWAVNQGDTTPDFVVGNEISVGAQIYIYSIPATTSSGEMYIGTSTISKMYIGQDEVEKIYFGQDLVYEKQASGFTASFTRGGGHLENVSDWSYMVQYSLDNGATYNAFTMTKDTTDYYIPEDITGITQIKFRVKNTGLRIDVKVKQGDTTLCQANSTTTWVESNNIELSADTSFAISCILDN